MVVHFIKRYSNPPAVSFVFQIGYTNVAAIFVSVVVGFVAKSKSRAQSLQRADGLVASAMLNRRPFF